MLEIMQCKTKTEKEAMESTYGTRYTVLARLPYYDTIRMAVIDPMHNLFCGKCFTAFASIFVCCDISACTIKSWETIKVVSSSLPLKL